MREWDQTQQPCWTCQNAVPSADGLRGCEWSEGLRPVPGWDAELVVKRGLGLVWVIKTCPRHRPDPPRRILGY